MSMPEIKPMPILASECESTIFLVLSIIFVFILMSVLEFSMISGSIPADFK